MMELVAERALIGVKPNGEEIQILIRIGKPEPGSEFDWGCPVELKGLYEKLGEIYAIDSFYALMLAITFIRKLLDDFVNDGGILFWLDTRQTVKLENLFSVGVELRE